MATSNHSATQTADSVACKHCGEQTTREYAYGYCSDRCYYSHKATNALDVLRQDHRLCPTCGGVLKEVMPPDEAWEHEHGSMVQVALNNGGECHAVGGEIVLDATECTDTHRTAVEAVVGFETPTEDAERLTKEIDGPDEYRRLYRGGIGCTCGTVDRSDTDDLLRESDPVRVLTNYVRTFRLLEREGAIQNRIDKETFFNTYRETEDFEYALGRALFA